MISILYPSRGRANKAYQTYKNWILDSGLADFQVVVSVDSSDPELELYKSLMPVIVNDNSSVVEAVNHASEKSTGDILLYLSDDFRCFPDWGIAVSKEFEGCTTPRILRIDDNLQGFHVRVLTMPIMNRAAFKELGYFFNPLYKSMWVDCDLYEVADRRGWIKHCKNIVFPHDHVSNGMAPDDDTYRRSAANWDQGKSVFDSRRKMRFI